MKYQWHPDIGVIDIPDNIEHVGSFKILANSKTGLYIYFDCIEADGILLVGQIEEQHFEDTFGKLYNKEDFTEVSVYDIIKLIEK